MRFPNANPHLNQAKSKQKEARKALSERDSPSKSSKRRAGAGRAGRAGANPHLNQAKKCADPGAGPRGAHPTILPRGAAATLRISSGYVCVRLGGVCSRRLRGSPELMTQLGTRLCTCQRKLDLCTGHCFRCCAACDTPGTTQPASLGMRDRAPNMREQLCGRLPGRRGRRT